VDCVSPNFVGRRVKTKNVTSNFCRRYEPRTCFLHDICDFGHPGRDAVCFGIRVLAFCRDTELAFFPPCKRSLYVIQRSANYTVNCNVKIYRYNSLKPEPDLTKVQYSY